MNRSELETRLRQAADLLEQRVRRGNRRVADELLEANPDLATDQDSALELIYREFVTLEEMGERPAIEELYRRFPQWKTELQRLLDVHDCLLGADTADIGEPLTTRSAVGSLMGRYTLLREIGEGGFGVVYAAEQHEPIHREVAVKIIKPGMDTREVIARFQAEAQALAMMNHPNIAQVLDMGTTDTGLPFFAMELVDGLAITEFCDRNTFSIAQRLQLFQTVCQAVQHAHQKGIIHRDLKPSNVLVSVREGVPVPKLIDFGVAKAMESGSRPIASITSVGQTIGTPAYMSPEQADRGTLDIDTRSDIYSLGAVLYELITGTIPLPPEHLRGTTHDEWRKWVADKDPPTPSTRLSTLGFPLSTVCENRQTDPIRLRKTVRGDLDRIVMKALEKERSRRYATASELAQDIERYLRHEPVTAAPSSVMYRLRKTVRRHRSLFTTGLVILAALIVGLMAAVTGLVHARREQHRAEISRRDERVQRHRAETHEAAAIVARNDERSLRQRIEQTLYFQRIARAQFEWQSNNLSSALQHLEACPPESRGWEWVYLNRLFHDHLNTLSGHQNNVRGLSFSADGQQLASCSGTWNRARRGEALVWKVPTGEQLQAFGGRRGGHFGIAFSPDGKQVAFTNTIRDRSGAVIVADAESGKQLYSHEGDGHYRVAFDRTGELLAAGDFDGNVRLWSARSGELRHTLVGRHSGAISCISFSPTSPHLAAVFGDGTTRIWDSRNGTLVNERPSKGDRSLAFSPDGQLLATCGYDGDHGGVVRVFRAKGNFSEKIAEFRVHETQINFLAFSPDGQFLAINGVDGRIRLCEPLSGRLIHAFPVHDGGGFYLAFSPDARILATGQSKSIKLWDMTRVQRPVIRRSDNAHTQAIAFSPDGQQFAVGGGVNPSQLGAGNKSIEIWKLHDPVGYSRRVRFLIGHADWITSIAYHPQGDQLVSGDESGAVRVWDVATAQARHTLVGHNGRVNGVAYHPDGKQIVSAGADGLLSVSDATNGKHLHTLRGHIGPVVAVGCFHQRHWAISAGADHTIRFWDLDRGVELQSLSTPGRDISCLALSSDAQRIAVGDMDGHIHVWRSSSTAAQSPARPNGPVAYQLETTFQGHIDHVVSLAISPDGNRLATFGSSRTFRIWDTTSWQEAIRLIPEGNSFYAYTALFSPDGSQLAASSGSWVTFWTASAPPNHDMSPERFMAWHERSWKQCRANENWFGSAFHLTELLDLQPDRADYRLARARSYKRLGQWRKAIPDYCLAWLQRIKNGIRQQVIAWPGPKQSDDIVEVTEAPSDLMGGVLDDLTIRYDDEQLLALAKVDGGNVSVQRIHGPSAQKWSGGSQLVWSPTGPQLRLTLSVIVPKSGIYSIVAACAQADDCGRFQLLVNDIPVGEPFDGYQPGGDSWAVVHSGDVNLGTTPLVAGKNELAIEVTGKHDKSKGFRVGIDYLRLRADLADVASD